MGLFNSIFKKKSFSDDIWADDQDSGETLSVWDAAEIWASNGKDEDYMFGYSEYELENAL